MTIINQTTELQKLSPFEIEAKNYLDIISNIEVKDITSLREATELKKQVTSFLSGAEKTRKSITDPIEQLKKSLIARANEVLAPAVEAKASITAKIVAYQEEQERIRQAEIDRVNKIKQVFLVAQVKATLEENQEMKVKISTYYNNLAEADQENPEIKEACQSLLEKVNQQIIFLIEKKAQEEEQARLAKLAQELDQEKAKIELEKIEQEKKQRELQAEERRLKDQAIRAEIEAEKLEAEKQAKRIANQAPKAGIRTYWKFEVVNSQEVPREYCSPSNVLINQAIKNGITEIKGLKIYQEKN
jgi:septal ring factor EnvC (AmiA/AmiB activator)